MTCSERIDLEETVCFRSIINYTNLRNDVAEKISGSVPVRFVRNRPSGRDVQKHSHTDGLWSLLFERKPRVRNFNQFFPRAFQALTVTLPIIPTLSQPKLGNSGSRILISYSRWFSFPRSIESMDRNSTNYSGSLKSTSTPRLTQMKYYRRSMFGPLLCQSLFKRPFINCVRHF